MCNGANCMRQTNIMAGARRFALRSPLGTDHVAEPDDILDAKHALRALGYYRTIDGSEPGAWVDNGLFDGIKAFQRDNGLKVDGFMRPGGETERAMNAALEEAPSPGREANDNQPPANENVAVLPWVGPMFRQPEDGGGGKCYPPRGPEENEGDCDYLYEQDSGICSGLKSSRARAICWSTANQRYAACIAGRPMPPLLTGDWPGD